MLRLPGDIFNLSGTALPVSAHMNADRGAAAEARMLAPKTAAPKAATREIRPDIFLADDTDVLGPASSLLMKPEINFFFLIFALNVENRDSQTTLNNPRLSEVDSSLRSWILAAFCLQ